MRVATNARRINMKRYKIVLNSIMGTSETIYIEALTENGAIARVNLIINDKWWAIYSVSEVSK